MCSHITDQNYSGFCWCIVGCCRRFSICLAYPPCTNVWFRNYIIELFQGGRLHEKGIGSGGKRRKWGDLSWSENPIWFLYQYITLAFYAEGVRSPYTPPSRCRFSAAALFYSFCRNFAKSDIFILTSYASRRIITMWFCKILAKWRFFYALRLSFSKL